MNKKVEKNIKEKITNEEYKKSKGFHITIKDLDKDEVVVDKDVKGMLGAYTDGEGGAAFEMLKGPSILRLALIQHVDDVLIKAKKGVIKDVLKL